MIEKKVFYTQSNIGKARYVVNYHDGIKRHPDGSPAFDIAIFKTKKDLIVFENGLKIKGYVER